jgi:molybdate transport system permease protein
MHSLDLPALAITARLAALTTALLLVLATPLAAWIAQRPTWPRRLVQALAMLPIVLPPTVLGFYLLEGLGPETTLGRILIRFLGHPLAFTFGGLIVGSLLYSLPFALAPLVTAFTEVDPTLRGTARVLGATPLQVFRRITLPLSRRAFFTAAILTFCHTVGEFGVVLMLGGDIPGSTRTLSISLFDQVQEANYTAANRTALLLMALSFATLVVLQWRPRQAAAAAGAAVLG